MNRILQIFERPRVLLPVIHACDEAQVIDQAVLAKKCGADGVFIINQGGLDVTEVLDVAALLTAQIPGWFVGVNLLGVDPVDARVLTKDPQHFRDRNVEKAHAGVGDFGIIPAKETP